MRARPDTPRTAAVMRPDPRPAYPRDIAGGRPSPAPASARPADSSGELPAARSYAVLDGTEPVEVVLHPGFVTWAGRDYAVVARADDPNPGRRAWSVIASVSARPQARARRREEWHPLHVGPISVTPPRPATFAARFRSPPSRRSPCCQRGRPVGTPDGGIPPVRTRSPTRPGAYGRSSRIRDEDVRAGPTRRLRVTDRAWPVSLR